MAECANLKNNTEREKHAKHSTNRSQPKAFLWVAYERLKVKTGALFDDDGGEGLREREELENEIATQKNNSPLYDLGENVEGKVASHVAP